MFFGEILKQVYSFSEEPGKERMYCLKRLVLAPEGPSLYAPQAL